MEKQYPENTLISFKNAFESGAYGVECDLQKSADGKFVIIHDDSLDRVSLNKAGMISEMTLQELKKSDLGNDQTVSEISELLEIIPDGRGLNLEIKEETIKPEDCQEIYSILTGYLKKEQIFVSSFNPLLLPFFKKMGIRTGLLIGKHKNFFKIINDVIKSRAVCLNLPVQMFDVIGKFWSSVFINAMKLAGKQIVFYTVNTRQEFEQCIKYSQIFITDRVADVKDYLCSVDMDVRRDQKIENI